MLKSFIESIKSPDVHDIEMACRYEAFWHGLSEKNR